MWIYAVLYFNFVISTNLFSKDKYRLYIKIGAQAKLPDEVRLPEIIRQRKVLNAKLDLKTAGGPYFQNEFSETEEDLLLREKLFGNKKKNKGHLFKEVFYVSGTEEGRKDRRF